MPEQHQHYLQQWAPECFPSHQAIEPGRSAAEHVKLRSSPLLGWLLVAVLLAFKFVGFRSLKKNLNLERKFLYAKDRKVHALLFAHAFETKIEFGFGLASFSTKPESALSICPFHTNSGCGK